VSGNRVVHYGAVGRDGLVFDCYWAEYRRHEASGDPTVNEHNRWLTRTVPAPARRTDLRKVTCPRCWSAIAALAGVRRAR